MSERERERGLEERKKSGKKRDGKKSVYVSICMTQCCMSVRKERREKMSQNRANGSLFPRE